MSESAADHKAPNYMLIWLYLFLLTVAEVGVAFLPIAKSIVVVALLAMAVWKAVMVGLY